ncbi:MAG: hypothetical protein LH469_05085 [Frankiaceae bacterium]|nr:hypothetical protein [Frankiaceae bacterium]
MPPPARRRRAGARPGQLPEQLRAALAAETDRLAGIDDPIVAIRAVGDSFAALDDELAALAQVRLVVVRALRQAGWSYDRIAEATLLGKGRVAQLARDDRGRPDVRP